MVIVGTCRTLCPAAEARERAKNRQLHAVFEKEVAIKRYRRPAAGGRAEASDTVRPPEVLQRVMERLMGVVLRQADFTTCYPFIWDRLWAVRQDLTLQQCTCATTRSILAQCVRFYVAAGVLCRSRSSSSRLQKSTSGGGDPGPVPLSVFDPDVNAQHLNDTIGRLLHLYEDRAIVDDADRAEVESLYLLLNADSFAAVDRAMKLHPALKRRMGEAPFAVATAFLHGNMYRVLRVAAGEATRQLGGRPLQWSALAPKLASIRTRYLRTLNFAYGIRASSFPLDVLARWLDMTEDACEQLLDACQIPVGLTSTTAAPPPAITTTIGATATETATTTTTTATTRTTATTTSIPPPTAPADAHAARKPPHAKRKSVAFLKTRRYIDDVNPNQLPCYFDADRVAELRTRVGALVLGKNNQ